MVQLTEFVSEGVYHIGATDARLFNALRDAYNVSLEQLGRDKSVGGAMAHRVLVAEGYDIISLICGHTGNNGLPGTIQQLRTALRDVFDERLEILADLLQEHTWVTGPEIQKAFDLVDAVTNVVFESTAAALPRRGRSLPAASYNRVRNKFAEAVAGQARQLSPRMASVAAQLLNPNEDLVLLIIDERPGSALPRTKKQLYRAINQLCDQRLEHANAVLSQPNSAHMLEEEKTQVRLMIIRAFKETSKFARRGTRDPVLRLSHKYQPRKRDATIKLMRG